MFGPEQHVVNVGSFIGPVGKAQCIQYTVLVRQLGYIEKINKTNMACSQNMSKVTIYKHVCTTGRHKKIQAQSKQYGASEGNLSMLTCSFHSSTLVSFWPYLSALCVELKLPPSPQIFFLSFASNTLTLQIQNIINKPLNSN